MANGGWYGTKEEWDRLEKPLLDIDPIIYKFAHSNSLSVTKNYKDWPERSITWGTDIRCLLQLYLVDKEKLTFNLWLCASQDRGKKRFWKQENAIEEKCVEEFKENLLETLQKSHDKLIQWSGNKELLTFAVELE